MIHNDILLYLKIVALFSHRLRGFLQNMRMGAETHR